MFRYMIIKLFNLTIKIILSMFCILNNVAYANHIPSNTYKEFYKYEKCQVLLKDNYYNGKTIMIDVFQEKEDVYAWRIDVLESDKQPKSVYFHTDKECKIIYKKFIYRY